MEEKYNKLRYILCGLLCFIATICIFANEHTTMGKDFWFSFGRQAHYYEPGYPYPQDFPMSGFIPQIRISTSKATRVTIMFTALTASPIVLDLVAGEAYTMTLNNDQKMAAYCYGIGTTRKSVHIVSTEAISVYALNQASGTADATNILPSMSLGTNYYHISYKPTGNNAGNFSDGYTIVAVENGTIVTDTKRGQSITLQAGDVYSYYTNKNTKVDLTGTYVTSNKPIAYFVTNSSVYIPETSPSADCLFQQMMPVSAWGSQFMIPLTVQKKERVRLIASEGNTNISIQGTYSLISGRLTNMTAGSFCELEITSGCYVSSNKAIGVCSYLLGSTYIGGWGDKAYGDPAMTWIPPVQQKVDSISLTPLIPASSTYLQHHYALIVVSTANKTETKITNENGDYIPLTGVTWTDHPSGYSFCSKLLYVTESSYDDNLNYGFTNPDGIIVYGYGLGNTGSVSGESYYYMAGAATRNLNPSFYVNNIHHENAVGYVFCGQNIYVEAAIYSRATNGFYVKWYLNDIEIFQGENLEEWSLDLNPGKYTLRMDVLNYLSEIDSRETEFTINVVNIINSGSNNIYVGDIIQLAGIGFPSNITGRWESSLPDVATVDQNGVVNAIGEGTTTITYLHNGCSASLTLIVEIPVIQNLWIGQGKGDPLFTSTQSNKNLWSISANWTANRLPDQDEIVEYHPEAIDLWVDGEYLVEGIKNLTNANLVVLANKKLTLTSSYEIAQSSIARVIVKAFVPTETISNGVNGTFITPVGVEAVLNGTTQTIPIPVEVEFYSMAESPTGVNNSGLMAWQYFGIPVRSVIANQALVGAAIRRYDETLFNYWVIVDGSETLLPIKGYEISWWETNECKGLFSFNGELENRDNSLVLTRTASNTIFSGQHVLSNPYTAGLSIANGLEFGDNLDKTVYLFHTGSSVDWDGWIAGGGNISLTGAGQYLAIPQNLAGSRTLSSMQGFVVKIQPGLTGADESRTLKLKYNGVGNNSPMRAGSIKENKNINETEDLTYTLAGISSKNEPKDCLWMFTGQSGSREFDNGYDGYKIFGAPHLSQFYVAEKDADYQITYVNDIDDTWLVFKAEKGISDYTLTFHHANINQIYKKIYLVDVLKDNHKIDITANGTEYHFTANNDIIAEKRFRIFAVRNSVGDSNVNAGQFNIYQENEILILNNGKDREAKVTIYNIWGTAVYQTHIESYSQIRMTEPLKIGAYLIHANYADEEVVKKILIGD